MSGNMTASHADGTDHGHVHDVPTSAVLRTHGKRLTVQRAAIWDVLTAEPDRHLTAEEVAERVRTSLPQVNPSTVYRTLDTLAEEGLVLRTDLGTGRAFFEPAHEHSHHHLVCETCGTVSHVHDDILGGIAARLRDLSGFELGSRELVLYGRCRDCATANTSERSPILAVP